MIFFSSLLYPSLWCENGDQSLSLKSCMVCVKSLILENLRLPGVSRNWHEKDPKVTSNGSFTKDVL